MSPSRLWIIIRALSLPDLSTLLVRYHHHYSLRMILHTHRIVLLSGELYKLCFVLVYDAPLHHTIGWCNHQDLSFISLVHDQEAVAYVHADVGWVAYAGQVKEV